MRLCYGTFDINATVNTNPPPLPLAHRLRPNMANCRIRQRYQRGDRSWYPSLATEDRRAVTGSPFTFPLSFSSDVRESDSWWAVCSCRINDQETKRPIDHSLHSLSLWSSSLIGIRRCTPMEISSRYVPFPTFTSLCSVHSLLRRGWATMVAIVSVE